MVRFSIVFLVAAVVVPAQRKPVTLDALAGQAPPLMGTVLWSPDGKRIAIEQGNNLQLIDVGTRSRRTVLSLSALTASATAVPAAEAFGWENRRVSEQSLQWLPDGKRMLAARGGDVFVIQVDAGGYQQLTATPYAERDPKLSPDGKKLAYRHNHDLYVMDLASRGITRLTKDGSLSLLNGELDWVYPEELQLGTAYWWAPDSQSIAYMQFDISREMVHPHVDMLGLYAKLEPQRFPKAGTPNADVRLGVVAAKGGATRWMDLGEMRDRLLARVHWTPDSKGLVAFRLNRVQNELHVIGAEAATGRSKVAMEEKDPAWINVRDDFAMLSKGEQAIFGSERTGYRHLYLVGKNGKELRPITSGEFEVTELVHVDEAGERVFYLSTEESPLERHLYVVGRDGQRRKLTKEKGTHAVEMSPNAEYWVDTYSSISEPSRTVLRDASGNVVMTLREPSMKAREEYEILPTSLLSFKGSDGTLYYARLIKPVNFDAAKKYPAIVMVYGGPHAQTVKDSYAGLSWDQVLAHRGFVIWQMDNRGSGARGHKWESVVNREFGKQELADQLEGVQYLKSLGFVDEKRIGIHGWSYGGYMTLVALLRAPDVFRAGISGAPVTDWRHYDTIYTERYMGLPEGNAEGYRKSSPLHYAGNLKGKLMLVHNYGDDNVLYQHNLQMQVELQKAGKHFDLLVYPQKSHGVTGAYGRHMREAMTEFFERHLR
ncbi:MAG: alpha/beta fold hydrolase [Acidobacteria bacterium]|nr:alpha/beta fold hydrolase [Acidobacteriota bacterium]